MHTRNLLIEKIKPALNTCISCVYSTSKQIFVGGIDGSIKFWQLPSLKSEKSLVGHKDLINVITMIKENILLTASDDSTLIKWDLQSCVGITKYVGHEKAVTCCLVIENNFLSSGLNLDLDFSILSGSWDKTIRIWNPRLNKAIRVLDNHTAPISSMERVTLKGVVHIVSGSINGELYFWDLKRLQLIVKINGHKEKINHLYVANDKLMSSSHDNLIKIWNDNFESVQEIRSTGGFIKKFFIFRENWLIFASGGKTIEIWDRKKRKFLAKETSKATIFDVIPHDDNRLIIASGKELKILRYFKRGLYVLYVSHKYRVQNRFPPIIVKEIYNFIIGENF